MSSRSSDRRRASLLAVSCALLASCATSTHRGEAIHVKLIALNDFHGQINPPASPTRIPDPAGGEKPLELPTGGIEYLSSLVTELKAQNPLNAVVAAGDLIGGTPLVSALFHHEPTIELLSQMGLDFASVGNHEFDAGRPELLRMQNGGCLPNAKQGTCANGTFAGAQFKYLAANVIDQQTQTPLLPAYAIKEFATPGGKRISVGFIGLVLKDTPSIVVPSGVAGLRFADEADSANALVSTLRARGVEAIVVLIHEGGETEANSFDDADCRDFTGPIKNIVDRFDPAIDIVISGHTHRSYICRHAGRLLTSAGSEGRILTDIDLAIDPQTRDITSASARQLAVVNDRAPNPLPQKYPTLPPDVRLTPLVEFYNRQAAPLAQREIGRITADISKSLAPSGESALGDFIADAQLAATRSAGAQVAFMNRGGMRADLSADRGMVTYSDVFAVHPFGNGLVTLTLTGEQIDALLEQQWLESNTMLQVSSGFTYEWDAAAEPGQRVDLRRIRLDGSPIVPTGRYRVTVNSFLAEGGDGFVILQEAPDRIRGIVDVEALEKYVHSQSPVSPPTLGRIKRLN